MTTTQQVEAALQVKQLRETLAQPENTPAPWAATAAAPGTSTANAPATKSTASASVAGAGTLATVEMSGELGSLKEGVKPYTNRPQEVFILSQIPPSLRGLSFIKATRSVKTPLSVQVLQPGRLYIACTGSERGRQTDVDVKYLGTLGFEKTPHSFVINDVTMVVCAKTVDTSFKLEPSQENSGFIVIGQIQPAPAPASAKATAAK